MKVKNLNHVEKRGGNEQFSSGKAKLDFTLEDFWSWSYSDLLNNVTRGCLAEFIVAKALKAKKDVRNPWATYDLDVTISGKRLKVEVKSAAYLQSWEQDEPSKIQFDIRKTKKLNFEKGKYEGWPKRHADVYVFALLKEKDDKAKASRLNVNRWDFYVVSTARLNNRTRSRSSITLHSLESEMKAEGVTYFDLRNAVLKAAKE
ncbi:MAG: hypothetical protein ABSD57_01295 [Verrucomicrobiota bacterium]|jgi:hypothetical protein